jgi:hypothetical protein
VADPQITQPDWGLCREPFFSGTVGFVQRCWWLAKGFHVRGPPTGSIRGAYIDCHGKRTCRVYRVFHGMVYIDSNHRVSQIWVTAYSWQSSRCKLME